jgi:MFS family permease
MAGVRRTVEVKMARWMKMTAMQAEMLCSSDVRRQTTNILLLAAFVDLAGAVLLMGSIPVMCANVNGAAPMGDVPEAFDASDFPDWVDYSLAINLVPVANSFGAIFSNTIAGKASDLVGRKIVIEICIMGGVLSYILMYASGMWFKNYWFFLGANFVNGLFGGIKGVISAFLQDIYEPLEFRKMMPTMINAFMFGAMGGSVIGLAWMAIFPKDLFGPAIAGMILSSMMACVVHRRIPEPPQPVSAADNAEKSPEGKDAEKPAPMPSKTFQILVIMIVAGGFDSFGDYGNRFARNTILTNRYELARQPVFNFVLMASNIVSVKLGMEIVSYSVRRLGYFGGTGVWTIVGNFFSAVVQFALAVILIFDDDKEALGAYVLVWLISQVLGICSTFAALFLFPTFIPAHQRGYINGIKNSVNSFVNCAAPITLSLIYRTGSLAEPPQYDRAAKACLFVCGTISTIAFLMFVPFKGMLPKDAVAQGSQTAKVQQDIEIPLPLESYDGFSQHAWNDLPFELRLKIQEERIRAGMERLVFGWDKWTDDAPHAEKILKRVGPDCRQMKKAFIKYLTENDDIIEKAVEQRKAGLVDDEVRQRKRREMGEWIADYLDDAGYDNWSVHGHMYKGMIMNAFPPMDKLDNEKASIDSVAQMRQIMMSFTKVLDMHIVSAEVTGSLELDDPAGSLQKIA